MSRSRNKIIFRWSEREKDWVVTWPGRKGASANAGLIMTQMNHIKTLYGTKFTEELATRNVDLKTLRVTIEIPDNKENE